MAKLQRLQAAQLNSNIHPTDPSQVLYGKKSL